MIFVRAYEWKLVHSIASWNCLRWKFWTVCLPLNKTAIHPAPSFHFSTTEDRKLHRTAFEKERLRNDRFQATWIKFQDTIARFHETNRLGNPRSRPIRNESGQISREQTPFHHEVSLVIVPIRFATWHTVAIFGGNLQHEGEERPLVLKCGSMILIEGITGPWVGCKHVVMYSYWPGVLHETQSREREREREREGKRKVLPPRLWYLNFNANLWPIFLCLSLLWVFFLPNAGSKASRFPPTIAGFPSPTRGQITFGRHWSLPRTPPLPPSLSLFISIFRRDAYKFRDPCVSDFVLFRFFSSGCFIFYPAKYLSLSWQRQIRNKFVHTFHS